MVFKKAFNLNYLLTAILAIASFFIIYFSFASPIMQDEGVFLTITKGLKDGFLPYRDFFDHKPPGIYLFLLPFVYFFGQNIVLYKFLLLVVNLSSVLLVYLISEKIKKNTGLISGSVFLVTLYIFEGYLLIAEPFMILFLLSSFWFLLKNDLKNKEDIFLAGILSGISILIKQPVIISVFVLLLFVFIKNKKSIVYFFLGLFLPFLVFLFWIIKNNLLRDAFGQIIILNFSSYPREKLIEVIGGLSQAFIASWFLWLGFFPSLFKKFNNKKILLLLIFLPIPVFLTRHYPHYWIQIIPFFSICFSIFFLEFKQKFLKTIFIILISLSFFGTVKWFFWMNNNTWQAETKEQEEMVKYINNKPSEYLLAENKYTFAYFLSNKKPLTEFLYLTEITDSKSSQDIVIEELEKNNSVYIIWPEDKAYAKKIEKYILENFRKDKTFKYLEMNLWVRN